MAYKNILVHIDELPGLESRIKIAVDLAKENDAHLTGLYTSLEPNWPVYAYGPVPTEALASLEKQSEDAARKAEQVFSKAVTDAGMNVDFRLHKCQEAVLDDVISLHARHSDLLIMGQSDPDQERPGGRDIPEDVIMKCGRPVLVVPYIGVRGETGRNVMVGWDGSREAARALNDSMPILEKAKAAHVIVVNPNPASHRHGDIPGADIALHLARHGINVEVEREEAPGMDADQVILSRVADEGIDLLVLGAYGSSRTREILFGGVTRSIVQHMTVPVLFSH